VRKHRGGTPAFATMRAFKTSTAGGGERTRMMKWEEEVSLQEQRPGGAKEVPFTSESGKGQGGEISL